VEEWRGEVGGVTMNFETRRMRCENVTIGSGRM
jgi:hypothetical protein